jgi:MFS superfamily sulfate permease-like transporter
LLVYSLTTTSIHTCVGPFALVSLLVAQLLRGALGTELSR